MWYTFSPIPFAVSSTQTELFGFIPALVSSFFTNTLPTIVVRGFKYPSLLTFVLTLVMLLVLIYIEGIRVELPITSIKYRGFQVVYPIKLLYVSNIPVILVSALGANVTFFSRLLYNYVGSNPPWWFHYIAVFPTQTNATTSSSYPTGGLRSAD